MKHLTASFALCDYLNPSFGYQVTIRDARTDRLIERTTVDGATGYELKTPQDCLRVIGCYLEQKA